ncbi:hypothetical protein CYLTODRAFT_445800 [Cylindrobasidium torrendii FP15055 ss-10]|uniref:Uncharacterized protein n=1 Tax=Cylindrobasidium torrendii FP15055 ss-10 TaxID=1314674 RepID=A0A0D7B2E1_9AGAR|nr:hypothetical protein CYLTODRAFT_445800 [Cylindrobasidium torrendii FP15055 ss-10]
MVQNVDSGRGAGQRDDSLNLRVCVNSQIREKTRLSKLFESLLFRAQRIEWDTNRRICGSWQLMQGMGGINAPCTKTNVKLNVSFEPLDHIDGTSASSANPGQEPITVLAEIDTYNPRCPTRLDILLVMWSHFDIWCHASCAVDNLEDIEVTNIVAVDGEAVAVYTATPNSGRTGGLPPLRRAVPSSWKHDEQICSRPASSVLMHCGADLISFMHLTSRFSLTVQSTSIKFVGKNMRAEKGAGSGLGTRLHDQFTQSGTMEYYRLNPSRGPPGSDEGPARRDMC